MSSRLSVIILTYRRDDALADTLRRLSDVLGADTEAQVVLVDNNADGVDRSPLLSAFPNALLIDEGFNMGVAGGRNKGLAAATGEFLLFLDDDALLDADASFEASLAEAFDQRPNLAVVAFRSFVGKDRVEDPIEFPHTDKTLDRAKAFDTFRFIGVAHAIRASTLNEVGPYCASFFYGMEEFDLAYRFVKRGYDIAYMPRFRVFHMKNVSGRLPARAVVRRMYTNKLSVGWMHLPFGVFVRSALAWAVKTALDSRSPVVPVKAFGDFLTMAAQGKILPRSPSADLVDAVRALGGVPWK